MKTRPFLITVILLACTISPMLVMAGRGNAGSTRVLTAKEASDIIFLREEEKVARDVYLAMLDLYGEVIFSNISESEQRHMDAVKGLIDKYGIEDPIVDDTPGVFSNGDLGDIYDLLIAKGSLSLRDALEVGILIEEMDIEDIELTMLPSVTKTDVERVLNNLLDGSYNHLDGFTRELAALD